MNPDSIVSFALAWSVISFYLYWPFFFKEAKKGGSRPLILMRIYGGLLFGFIPLLLLGVGQLDPLSTLRISIPTGSTGWHLLAIGLIPLAILVSSFQARSRANLAEYPQIRNREWDARLIIQNAASWMFYLLGYEILFRGFLFFPLLDTLGIEWALLINITVYSLSHAAKSIREGLGTLPIGLLLVLVAWKTNSVVYPILIHWAMALSNSFFSVYHHPEMRFVKQRIT